MIIFPAISWTQYIFGKSLILILVAFSVDPDPTACDPDRKPVIRDPAYDVTTLHYPRSLAIGTGDSNSGSYIMFIALFL